MGQGEEVRGKTSPCCKKPNRAYAMSGAQFTQSAFMVLFGCFERIFVKTAPGRFRLNVIGALNATTHEMTALYNNTYITAQTVVAMLEKVAKGAIQNVANGNIIILCQ